MEEIIIIQRYTIIMLQNNIGMKSIEVLTLRSRHKSQR